MTSIVARRERELSLERELAHVRGQLRAAEEDRDEARLNEAGLLATNAVYEDLLVALAVESDPRAPSRQGDDTPTRAVVLPPDARGPARVVKVSLRDARWWQRHNAEALDVSPRRAG